MWIYLTLLVSLLYVSSAAANGLAILRARQANSFGNWRAASFCATYNSNWTQNISTTSDSAEYFPVVFDGDGCSLSNVSSLDGLVSVVHRGNCTFQSKVTIAEEKEVNGLVIVYNSSSVLPVPAGSNKSQLPVFMVTSTTGQFLQLHSNDGLEVGVYAPPTSTPAVDGSLAILFTIAVVTILLSAGFATKPFAFMKRDLHQPEGGLSLFAVAAQEREEKAASGCASWLWKLLWIGTFVVFVCTFLILLYFFYYPLVYGVLAMFGIGASLSLYCVLSPFVNLLPSVGRLPRNKIPILRNRPDIKFFITIAVALGVVIWWIVERHASYAWVLHDILGMTFIMMVTSTLVAVLDTWMVSILLVVMLFYDVFFVFITPFITHGKSVMVQAVTGGGDSSGPPAEQLPIMFLAPKLYLTPLESVCGSLGGFSSSAILGYGDVAIPSLLIALCLQFDLSHRSKSCCLRLYFLICSIGYGVGLMIAFLVLTLTRSAQPALLYLVPCTLLPVLLVATVRRELSSFLNLKQKQRSDGGSINTKSSSPRSSHAESKEESEENEEHNQLLESDHV